MNKLHSSDVPPDVDGLLIDIQFAIGLPCGYKLNVSNYTYSQSSVYESTFRYMNGESKIKTLNFLNNIITRAVNACIDHPEYQPTILAKVKEMSICINNLISVYANVPLTKCELELMLSKIKYEPMINAIKEKMKERCDKGYQEDSDDNSVETNITDDQRSDA